MFGVIITVIMIIIAIILLHFNYNDKQNNYEISDIDDDYEPINSNYTSRPLSQTTNIPNDIDNSYAFANRLKNLIFSRHINEQDLLAYLGITASDLKKYKFSMESINKYQKIYNNNLTTNDNEES